MNDILNRAFDPDLDDEDEFIVSMLEAAHASLIESTLKLNRYNQGHPVVDIDDITLVILGVFSDCIDQFPPMKQAWELLLAALASTPTRDDEHIHLKFVMGNLEAGGSAYVSFLDAFKTLHCPRFSIMIPEGGAEFATANLKINSTMQALEVNGGDTVESPFKLEKSALLLVDAVISHPSLERLIIRDCDVGTNTAAMSSLVPVLHHIEAVNLDRNNIGSHGASLLANCLATNPLVKHLSLASNALADDDLSKIAVALKTNTTLRCLEMIGNDFTEAGYRALFDVVRGQGTFNDVYDANHICFIDLLANRGINEFDDPVDNMIAKLLSTVFLCPDLDAEIPPELMPRFLVLLQAGGRNDSTAFDPLNTVFRFVREEFMLLFNTRKYKICECCGGYQDCFETFEDVITE